MGGVEIFVSDDGIVFKMSNGGEILEVLVVKGEIKLSLEKAMTSHQKRHLEKMFPIRI